MSVLSLILNWPGLKGEPQHEELSEVMTWNQGLFAQKKIFDKGNLSIREGILNEGNLGGLYTHLVRGLANQLFAEQTN